MTASTPAVLDRMGWDLAIAARPGRPVLVKVTGNSMLPSIHAGDLAVVWPSVRAFCVGDIVLLPFDMGRSLAIHRIVFRLGEMYLVKGDANLAVDGWFGRADLLGKAVRVLAPTREDKRKWRPANRLRDRVLGLALSGLGTGYQASRLVARRAAITLLGEPRARSLKSALKTALFRR